MFEKEYILGIDIGTSSLKGCAVDCRGSRLGERNATYPTLVPHAGWAEQDLDEWIGAVQRANSGVLSSAMYSVSIS